MNTTTNRCRRRWLRVALALCGAWAGLVHAQQAWLDRDRIQQGETVTLNIQSDGDAAPDYDPLRRDFDLSGHSSRSRLEMVNGRTRRQSLFAVALRPRRAGEIEIPALDVGTARTRPLTLFVQANAAPAVADADADVFIQSEPDDADPYVQQAVGWVVRLYSAAPLISGQLLQPAPDGATLQQVGEDARYWREVQGRRFEVVERRYQLIPERSGPLTVPGASFEGRGTGGLFDELFGGRGASLRTQAPSRVLQVQPAPANAPQPWLPLRDLRLRYATTPHDLRAGSAGTLTVEATADGASAAQMPELQLPPIDGMQVFAEPVQADETFRDGRPRVKLTRRFSLVPTRPGKVALSGMQLSWWDVAAGRARTAQLPAMSWTVAAADGTPSRATAGMTPVRRDATAPLSAAPVSDAHRGWALAALLFAALWLFTLVWGLQRRAPAFVRGGREAGPPPVPAGTHAGRADASELHRALDTGDLGDVAHVLCALATPPVHDIDALRARLADAAQRQAVDALQRARWGGGDGVAARQALRKAFARGPRWLAPHQSVSGPLPPLYPNG